MFRTALLRSARSAACSAARFQAPIARPVVSSFLVQSRQQAPAACFQAVRCYSAQAGLSKEEVQGRIIDLLKNFDKVQDASKLSPTSHFSNDLGLDSLDTVEVVMAIEEEFSIEIPDKDADAIHTVDKAVEYILSQPDGETHTFTRFANLLN
ncbi:acyl carrier protein [Saccharata proteae CBS 121410]|uniref:Acyl carrier protein n=1 Tax=Saccharata proteae CBS 121410 TaxID=1314787 RepID=A0A9P4M171_9PEZI|nr:acyl carrier protein [Saccharata proteae CBS 121410]